MASTFSKWDAADYINTTEDVIVTLDIALEDDDPKHIGSMIGAIARSKGMTELARETGLNRVSLYKALSEEGNPSLMTVLKVLHACGYTFVVQPLSADALAMRASYERGKSGLPSDYDDEPMRA